MICPIESLQEEIRKLQEKVAWLEGELDLYLSASVPTRSMASQIIRKAGYEIRGEIALREERFTQLIPNEHDNDSKYEEMSLGEHPAAIFYTLPFGWRIVVDLGRWRAVAHVEKHPPVKK